MARSEQPCGSLSAKQDTGPRALVVLGSSYEPRCPFYSRHPTVGFRTVEPQYGIALQCSKKPLAFLVVMMLSALSSALTSAGDAAIIV